jgi:WD40 repeat protein
MRFNLKLAAAIVLTSAGLVRAEALTPGDILVSQEVAGPYYVYEYTPTGALVQTFDVPPLEAGASGVLRKAVVDSSGEIQVYAGTFSPSLATVNPLTGAVSYHQGSGFSSVNNITFGGVADYGQYVYVSDMNTGGSAGNGILRFNTSDYSSQEFASGTDYTRVQMGLDGLLYAITGSDGNASEFDVFNPITMQFIRRIDVPDDIRSIAVAANGDIFAADWGSVIREYDPNGNQLNSLSAPGVAYDLDLSPSGMIVASSWGTMSITNTSLSSIQSYNVGGGWPDFVSFVTVPEPSSIGLICLLAGALLGKRRRKDSAT